MSEKLLRHISWIGVGVYFLALIVVSVVFRQYALQAKWMLWGAGEVLFFFVGVAVFYPRWKHDSPKLFRRKVFLTAFAIRALYAFLVSYYYYYQTGIAFEYEAGDSLLYHTRAVFLMRCLKQGYVKYVLRFLGVYTMGFSDRGYTLWLTMIYYVFGPSLLTPRLFKAAMSAYLCIVVHKLGSRTFGERTGRLAAVMCLFMPIFVHSCVMHTKETEMIFLSILAIERMDNLIRTKKYTVWNVFSPIFFTALTFGFRTVIGMCLIFAFAVFIILSPNGLIGKKGRIITIAATAVVFFAFLFSPIGNEMTIIFRQNFRYYDYQSNRIESLGMKYSNLAKGSIVAPGALVLPLAPLVEEAPDHNKMIHGCTYVKNFLGFFAMLAIVIAFRQKKWRDFSLIGAYVFSYLGIVMFSFAFNSERFHQPIIPLILLMSGYAMTHLRRKDLRLLYVYCGVLLVALFVWNYLKLSARGVI